MEKMHIDLFDSPADSIEMPKEAIDLNASEVSADEIKSKLKNVNDLISEPIDKAILGSTVKSLMIPEDLEFIYPNYVLDFSEVESVDPIQMMALDAFLNTNGDTALYICTNGGIQRLGMAYNEILNRVLATCIDNIFNSKCKVYRNFKPGEPATVITTKDIGHMRLSI